MISRMNIKHSDSTTCSWFCLRFDSARLSFSVLWSVSLSSSWLKRSTAMPRAIKPRPVRIHARKVRSLARCC